MRGKLDKKGCYKNVWEHNINFVQYVELTGGIINSYKKKYEKNKI